MHLFAVTTALTVTIALAGAQVFFNTTTDEFVCPLGKAAFCAGNSLETNIIVRCNGTFGQPGNCNDNLAGLPPIGVKFAQCYECSLTSGTAACSFENIVYPDTGSPFSVAYGDSHCNSTDNNNTWPSGSPINSANISSTLSYAHSVSMHDGNAVHGAEEGPMTTTVTSYGNSDIGTAQPKSVTVAPGSGGYSAPGGIPGVASATATPIASSSPIATFTGDAYEDEVPYIKLGFLAVVAFVLL